jgi:ion channel-forming bestrophin family protein
MIQYDPHRWIDHFFDIKGSLVREISGRVFLCTVWSAGVVYFHLYVTPIGIPSIIHTLVGVALGLLLVFRTNASYDRFWEGRKLWGGMVNETRNLIRASEAYLASPELRKEVALWTIAFTYASMHVLRDKKSLGPVESELDPAEVEAALASPHPALYAARRISLTLQRAKTQGYLSDFRQITLDQNVQLLVDYLGGCERIHRTPLPFAYVVHLRRALVIYCFTLPFALVEVFDWKWATVLDTLFLAYVYFGIEEIGVEIEDPFGEDDNDLPLEAICMSISKNTRAFLTSH